VKNSTYYELWEIQKGCYIDDAEYYASSDKIEGLYLYMDLLSQKGSDWVLRKVTKTGGGV
jgi:hypothetical protein